MIYDVLLEVRHIFVKISLSLETWGTPSSLKTISKYCTLLASAYIHSVSVSGVKYHDESSL